MNSQFSKVLLLSVRGRSIDRAGVLIWATTGIKPPVHCLPGHPASYSPVVRFRNSLVKSYFTMMKAESYA